MSERPDDASDKKDSDEREAKAGKTEDEFVYFAKSTAANGVGRDVNTLQADVINGDVIYGTERARVDLVARRATKLEREEADHQFVAPPEFTTAQRALREYNIVVLCGRNTGRSHTARKLLVDFGVVALAELNPYHSLDSARKDELEADSGYVWEADESSTRPLTERAFTHIAKIMRELGSRLVIVLGDQDQTPGSAASCTVTLTAPSAVDVALEVIRCRRPGLHKAEEVFKSWLADALVIGSPPVKAVRAADLAIRIAEGHLEAEQALKELREDAPDAVRQWAAGKSVIDFAMSFAVAVLENQPYDEVVAHAFDLDKRIREAELREGKTLRPRQVFSSPKVELLRDNNAEVMLREHPTHQGQSEETVRFRRQDWAHAVLCHVWRQYPSAHPVIRDWMCGSKMRARFTDPARRALCTITAEVPAHEPLRWVDELAASRKLNRRLMAVSMLERLADAHRMRPLALQALRGWVDKGTVNRQWTAAIVYGSPLGRQDLPDALENLQRIAKSKWLTPRYGALGGVLMLLAEPECRGTVLSQLLAWSESSGRHPGPRQVAYSATLHLTGFDRKSNIDPAEFVRLFPGELHTLLRRTLNDGDAGPIALDRLRELALEASASEQAAEDVVRIASLIAPDLRWWARPRWLVPLIQRHPRTAWTISWIFHVARREQRKRNKKVGSSSPTV